MTVPGSTWKAWFSGAMLPLFVGILMGVLADRVAIAVREAQMEVQIARNTADIAMTRVEMQAFVRKVDLLPTVEQIQRDIRDIRSEDLKQIRDSISQLAISKKD